MSIALSGGIAVVLLFCHRYFTKVNGSSDVFFGMASAMFWMLFSGASAVYSAMDVTDIYFYFFFFGIGMAVATLISALSFKPNQETKQEQRQDFQSENGNRLDSMRKKMGLRPLNRR